jgi:cell wall-associated NlpC family hydrolase
MTGAELVAEAKDWINTRYKHQSSKKGIGTDCIGLIAGVARNCGVPDAVRWDADPRNHAYSILPSPVLLFEGTATYLQPARGPWQLGDVLLLKIRSSEPNHFALISALDPVYIIHAYFSARRVVENRLDQHWRAGLVGAYRFRGL